MYTVKYIQGKWADTESAVFKTKEEEEAFVLGYNTICKQQEKACEIHEGC